ncbi:MAG: hypothetical protein ACT4QC_23645 [Planctomycetaceae bacterium]
MPAPIKTVPEGGRGWATHHCRHLANQERGSAMRSPFGFDEALPIDRLLAESRRTPSMEAVRLLAPAEVIFGWCPKTNGLFLLYGRERHNQIVEAGAKSGARTLTIAFDESDLELVAMVIEQVKGSFEFKRF